MTNEEFEKKWTENRKEVLANNEEYQRIAQTLGELEEKIKQQYKDSIGG